MERSFYELLSYLVRSALECADEPSPYGALRLMGGAERLLRFGLTHGLAQDRRWKQWHSGSRRRKTAP